MKQKNFSKVLAESSLSPLRTTVSGYVAKILPKHFWSALLVLMAFLFPSGVMAQNFAISDTVRIPADVMFDIDAVPALATKNFPSEHFSVEIAGVYELSSFAVDVNPTKVWGTGVSVSAGDIYQLKLILKAEKDWVFTLNSTYIPLLPIATTVTNWGTATLSTKQGTPVEATDKVELMVAYQVPKTIETSKVNEIDIFTATTLSTDKYDIGKAPSTTEWKSEASNPQWVTTKPAWTGTLVDGKFAPNYADYKVTGLEFIAAPGYTFVGMAANTLKIKANSTYIDKATVTQAKDMSAAATIEFKKLATWPSKEVAVGAQPVAGQLANGIAVTPNTGWDTQSNWKWSAGVSSDGKFLPDSTYTLIFDVTSSSGYNFFGTAANYYTGKAGSGITSVTHKDQLRYVAANATKEEIKITFAKTAANPDAGKIDVIEPVPGAKNTYKPDTALVSHIPGVKSATVRRIYNVNTSANLTLDSVFAVGQKYGIIVTLKTDQAHTFFYDGEGKSTKYNDKYSFNDVKATRLAYLTDSTVTYTVEYLMPTTLATGTVGVHFPVAGVKVGDSKAITTGTLFTRPITASDSSQVTEYEVAWYEAGETTPLEDEYVFEPATRYDAQVKLVAPAGYTTYKSATSAYTLYMPAVVGNPTWNVSNPYAQPNKTHVTITEYTHAANSDIVTFKFYPTANSIKAIAKGDTLHQFVAPVAGVVPFTSGGTDIPSQNRYNFLVEWNEDGKTDPVTIFEAEKVYIAKVKVNGVPTNFWSMAGVPAGSYFIPEELDATKYEVVDGSESVVVTDTTNYATVTYKFAPTEKLITIKDLEFSKTDFIYPTSGWLPVSSTATANYPKVGVEIPKAPVVAKADTIVDNDEYIAEVVKWTKGTSSATGIKPENTSFLSDTYKLWLQIKPKEGYTVYGLDKVIDPTTKEWATYTAGGAQVKAVETSATGAVTITFEKPLATITEIAGFPALQEKDSVAIKADLAGIGYTIDAFDVEGYVFEQQYAAGELYTYTLKLTAKKDSTFVGLAQDTLIVKDDSNGILLSVIEHAANDLSEVKISFKTAGERIRDYALLIEAPVAGETPATSVETQDAKSISVVWTPTDKVFIKDKTYSVSVTLEAKNSQSFFGVPKNAFHVIGDDSLRYSNAFTSNDANGNVITIQFPTINDALLMTVPEFSWEYEGYLPVEPKPVKLENTSNRSLVIDKLEIGDEGKWFRIETQGLDTIKPADKSEDWTIVPVQGLKKANYNTTIALYYHVANTSVPLYTTKPLSLNIYGVGIANPEAAGLNAYGVNGILTIKGLTAGEPFSVHNAQGILVYRGVAQGAEITIPAPIKGVYFVTSADKTLKVLNN
jgi:hypothetical protein